MADMVHPTHARIEVINAVKRQYSMSSGGSLKVGLYKDALTPTAATSFATFTGNECTFPGYARVDANFPDAVDNGSGDAHSYSALVTFTRGAGGSGDSVGGLMLVCVPGASGASIILAYKDFATPVDMSVVGTTLSRLVEWLQGQYPIS